MAEEFAVDGAFGYGAAVYGDVGVVFAWTVLVNYLGKFLFTDAAFAGYQHRKVSRRHLHGDVDGVVECCRNTYDAETLFYGLNFSCLHKYDKISV